MASRFACKFFKPLDLLAGISVAAILLPEAVAYATIAHLSIQSAIYALLIGLCCYAMLGKSPFAIVSSTSSSATLLAAAAASFTTTHHADYAAFCFALVILTGLGLMMMSIAKLGRLSAFISRPVLYGFSFALATTIIIKQLPPMFGITINNGMMPMSAILELCQRYADWSWPSFVAGIVTLFILLSLKRYTRLPAAFIVLVLGVMLTYFFDLSQWDIQTVGPIALHMPHLAVPHLSLKEWLNMAELVVGLIVIIFAESWSSIRTLSTHDETIEPNRELFALGAANLMAGLLQSMPVGAGFSASIANKVYGAQSKWAGIITALSVFVMIVLGQSFIAHIPTPVLAATVMGALSHTLDLRPLIVLWKMNRDQYISLVALCAVLLVGVLHGMLIAVALSILATIRKFSQATVCELVELNHTRNYVDKTLHPQAVSTPHMLILRPEEPLFFGNAEGIIDSIHVKLKKYPDCEVLILSLEQSSDLDSTAIQYLIELHHTLKHKGIRLLLARVKDPVRDLLLHMAQPLFYRNLFWSVTDAADYATVTQHTNK